MGHVRTMAGCELVTRRTVLRGALMTAGAGAGAAAIDTWRSHLGLPVRGGYAPAADALDAVLNPNLSMVYYVRTVEPVVAFTFDDGPGPRYTPKVLDLLAEHDVPATFFLVGRNVVKHGDLLRGRLDGHEVGNHSWSHPDFATMDLADVHEELGRCHDAIKRVTTREPRLLRPPYGHLGGSTVLAANTMGYDVALWSQQMHEVRYRDNPAAQVRDIVENTRPGAIILAHDVGDDRRLVTISGLAAMFSGLRARGFRFATVSELMAIGQSSPPPRLGPNRSPVASTSCTTTADGGSPREATPR